MPEILRMPEVAANTTEAILESWNVPLNTQYSAGAAIVTVETEKAVVDVEAESDGVLLHLLVDAGATVPVGTPIAIWGTSEDPPAEVEALLASVTNPTTAVEPDPVVAKSNGTRIFASPLARRLARELAVDLNTITGTGPNGRIRRPDIEAAVSATTQPAPPQSTEPVQETQVEEAPRSTSADERFVDVANSRMRTAIARRLAESKATVPHFYLRGSARVDELMALRREINDGGSIKVSVNDLLVKAIARAYAEMPAMNVQWNGDSIRHFSDVDIAVAVATDNGLVTPVVRGVDTLSIGAISAATKDLITRAKDRRLRQDELEGGSISITNLGMYGTEDFAAIINPPQAAILAVGAIRQEAVVDNGTVTAASVLRMTLAVDHRPVDGAVAAQWMKALIDLLEQPLRILL